MSDTSDKTEEPTPRRLRKARERGDAPVSSAFVSSVGFLLPLVLVPAVAEATAARAGELVRSAANRPDAAAATQRLAFDVLVLSAPIVLAAALGAAAAGLVQTQGAISASRLAVRFASNVFPGNDVEVQLYELGDGAYGFEATSAGATVIKYGRAEVR